MHPACAQCKGACCETLVVPIESFASPDSFDTLRWASLRGTVKNRRLRVEARCSALSECGACTIHATRPQPCRDYAVGSPGCLDAVRTRRTGNDRAAILEAIGAHQ